jgi:SAM-dependent methyltransferase
VDLWDLVVAHQGRDLHKLSHYFQVYERHFGGLVGREATFVEIGCGRGGSLQLWKEWFGPQATIVGLDIDPEASEFEEDQIHVRIGDQGDTRFLASVLDEFGTPDAILDDGSHRMADLLKSFRFLYPNIASDGVYAVEDAHTSYWPRYGGGLRKRGTFIERSKRLIDELNAHSVRGRDLVTPFTDSTVSICFYESMVVFERGATDRSHVEKRAGELVQR